MVVVVFYVGSGFLSIVFWVVPFDSNTDYLSLFFFTYVKHFNISNVLNDDIVDYRNKNKD